VEDVPDEKLNIIVVIPCHNEPDVNSSIRSLMNCEDPGCAVEVVVVINAGREDSDSIKEQNQKSYEELNSITDFPSWMRMYCIMNNEFAPKKAGVGMARKIGMDDAVRRFEYMEKLNGVIVCYDADSQCDPNYLKAINEHFSDPKITSASINYEHPTEGEEFGDDIYNYIMQYELHLRYFIAIQKSIGLPYAYHTVGSSMACTMDAYCAVGGMNMRKAGEDFYFLHKLIKYGGHSELNSTRVIPSPRISDRVPFGTGKAVGDMSKEKTESYMSYRPLSFMMLKEMVDRLPEMYENQKFSSDLPKPLLAYLATIDGDNNLTMIIKNTSDYPSFEKRFWNWFDAFQLMKYLHFVREESSPDLPVMEASDGAGVLSHQNLRERLSYYRQMYR